MSAQHHSWLRLALHSATASRHGSGARVTRLACLGFVLAIPNPAWADQATAKSDTIVRVVQTPIHTDAGTLVAELTIGVVDGPPEYILSGVSDLLPLADGSILILESQPVLRQYAADGKYIRTFGRRGEGPGEYTAPTGLAQLPDGRILLGDTQNGRINVYLEDGQLADTWRLLGYPPIIGGREWLTVDKAGMVYLKFRLPPNRATFPPSRETAILRMQSGGTIVDTIFPPKLPDPDPPPFWVVSTSPSGGRGYVSTRVAYLPWSWWSLSPLGYFVTGLGNRYAVDLRIPPVTGPTRIETAPVWKEGDPVTSIRRDIPPLNVSARERRDQRAFTAEWIRRQNGRLEGNVPDVPETKPFFKYMFVGEAGRIWVNISTPSERFDPPARLDPTGAAMVQVNWREPTAFDVFEPDGRYVGQVNVPYGTSIKRARGDLVWAVVRNDLDVESVVRFRIAWRQDM